MRANTQLDYSGLWLIDQVVLKTTAALVGLESWDREISREAVLDALFPGNASITVGVLPTPDCCWDVTREQMRGREDEQWCRFIGPNIIGEEPRYVVVSFNLSDEHWFTDDKGVVFEAPGVEVIDGKRVLILRGPPELQNALWCLRMLNGGAR